MSDATTGFAEWDPSSRLHLHPVTGMPEYIALSRGELLGPDTLLEVVSLEEARALAMRLWRLSSHLEDALRRHGGGLQ